MEDHERRLVVDQLTTNRERVLGLVNGLTAEQWAFHPAEGRWSIGECVEHITRVESRILGAIEKKLGEGAHQAAKSVAEQSEIDNKIKNLVPNRTIRREAPEAVRPTGQWPDEGELMAAFEETRQRTTEFAGSTQGNMREYFIPHPAFGEIDCYQWLVLLGLHGGRHAQQIEEIKSAPGFPR